MRLTGLRAYRVAILTAIGAVLGATGAAADDRSAMPEFRLGTAGGPFGWTTLIADLNRDRRADVVVADAVGAGAGRGYRIALQISGEQPATVTFRSAQSAIAIRVADVDHDRDLDLLVTVPLSETHLMVWRNDGRGRFTPASARLNVPGHRLPAQWRPPLRPRVIPFRRSAVRGRR